ncbi:MAG: glutathione S-transferase [Deltaproteobacteria bacterium]|nr:glutathione S-transferase [Deltaproteobacteria bacterium]
MKFYDCSTAPSPRRVRIFIAEKGLDIPTVQVDLRNGEHLTESFRKLNPWCTVPVLELDDGTTVSEAVAVCRYLEETRPEPPLMGVDARDRARVAMWEHRFEIDGFLAVTEAFRNQARGLKGRALTGPDGAEQIPELVQRGRARVERFFADLDRQLADHPFVTGERYTIADITAQVTVDFAGWIKMSLPPECRHATDWYERVSQRPSAAA